MQTEYQTTSTTVTTEEKLTAITATLESLDQQLSLVRAQITQLDENGICTGTVYWRRDDGKPPKLYANHSVNQTCPTHGQPSPDSRLRVYVGTDPERQAEVLAAMERCKEKSNLESAIRQIEIQHNRIERAITTAWRAATGQQRWEW